jgi:hypothetical protein
VSAVLELDDQAAGNLLHVYVGIGLLYLASLASTATWTIVTIVLLSRRLIAPTLWNKFMLGLCALIGVVFAADWIYRSG